MRTKAVLVIFASLIINTVINPVSGFSQEAAQEDKSVYYIRTIDFDITGRTRPFAIINAIDLQEGEELRGKHSLETYIQRKTQLLRNKRVFDEEKCRIDYTIGEAEDNGRFPVDLLVHVNDAWNMIALPEPKYDSNTGLSITLKARDYNFLGTMSPLELNLGYENNEDQNSAFVDIDADIPFKFLGYFWNFNFDNVFTYNEFDPNYYKNVTGLTMDLPWKHTTFTFGFDQSFILNEENTDEEKYETGYDFFDGLYMSSDLYARWNIPLGIEVGEFGGLSYNPSLSENFKYRPGGDIGEYRRGPSTTFSHSVGFGQINWIGNFRKGLTASISNSVSFNEFNLFHDGARKGDWGVSATIAAEWHMAAARFFGISSRIKYTEYFNTGSDYSAGSYLRGIRNDDLIADRMLSFNLELPLRILPFNPSQWFESRAFRPLDLEFHLSPFIDLALITGKGNDAQSSRSGENYSFGDLLAGGGFEIIAFSLPWRSLYLRASIGWDLREWHRQGNLPGGRYRELYIGLGHFF